MPREVFISYRRDDDAGMALALHAHLTRSLTEESIFMDVEDGIPPGHDFVMVLEERVAECKIMLVLIGSRWLNTKDRNGARRLDNPDDFVRIEVETAINMGKTVIPVLINDTEMPRAADLPDTMKAFARRQAVFITSKRLRADAEGLVRILQREWRGLNKSTAIGPVLVEQPAHTDSARIATQAVASKPEPIAFDRSTPDRKHVARAKTSGPLHSPVEPRTSTRRRSRKSKVYLVVATVSAIIGLLIDFGALSEQRYGPPGEAIAAVLLATTLFGGLTIAFLICAKGTRTGE